MIDLNLLQPNAKAEAETAWSKILEEYPEVAFHPSALHIFMIGYATGGQNAIAYFRKLGVIK